jgi:hypothetical protein
MYSAARRLCSGGKDTDHTRLCVTLPAPAWGWSGNRDRRGGVTKGSDDSAYRSTILKSQKLFFLKKKVIHMVPCVATVTDVEASLKGVMKALTGQQF